MIFWNDQKLAYKLKNDKLSEKEKFHYYLVTVVIFTICGSNGGIISLILQMIGLSYIFKTNSRGDNKSFIERVVCLSLPIAVKILTTYALIIVSWLIILRIVPSSYIFNVIDLVPFVHGGEYKLYLIIFVIWAALLLYYYIRLNKCIKIACGLTEEK